MIMRFTNGDIVVTTSGKVYKLINIDWDLDYYKQKDPRGWHKAEMLYPVKKNEVFLVDRDLKEVQYRVKR